MNCILTLDVGTTSVKTCLFDYSLNQLCCITEEYLLDTANGFVELDAEKYIDAIKQGIKKAKIEVGDAAIKAVISTTQGETLICTDKEGTPLRKAIVWLDSRADEQANKVNCNISSENFAKTTGLPELSGACPVAKLLWIKENEEDIYQKTEKFMLLEDYIVYRLTGRAVTEKSLVCSTGYFDLEKDEYWDEILDLHGLSKSKLPELLECGELCAVVSDKASAEFGLDKDTKVFMGAMDQVASAIGAGAFSENIVTETTGTALVVTSFANERKYLSYKGITEYRHIKKGTYLNLAFSNTAGMVLKWFKDKFCSDFNMSSKAIYDKLSAMAADVPALSDGLILFPHFEGVNFPEVNTSAKGVYFGIGLDMGRAHFVRALYEGVSYMLRENIEKLECMSKEIKSLGGASVDEVWCSIKADVTKKSFITYIGESTSRGAAILALCSMGVFKSFDEAFEKITVRKEYFPGENSDVYQKGYERYMKMYDHFKELF